MQGSGKKSTAERQNRNNFRAPPLHISQNFKSGGAGRFQGQQSSSIQPNGVVVQQQSSAQQEISPKHQARLYSMEPPQTNAGPGKKIVINSARGPPGTNGGAFSERDPSGEPIKGMQMSQAYQSTRLNPQLTQRKSRGGRDPQKNHQSVEPPNIHLQSNSINAIGTPGANWKAKGGHN